MKKYTNRIKLMPKFTKCMSLAMILTFTSYEEAFAEMSYAEQTNSYIRWYGSGWWNHW